MSQHHALDEERLLDSEYLDFDGFFGAPDRAGPAPPRIDYGTVCYDGPAYLLLGGAAPPDLDRLLERSADRGGLSRYGCMGEPTWYVALDRDSAIAEVCYHTLSDCRRGAGQFEWTAYQVRVRGRFADLHGRERRHPQLVADDYRLTHALAREVRDSRQHGILYPSARSNGVCIAAFDAHVFRSFRRIDGISLRVKSAEVARICPQGSRRWRVLRRDELQRHAARAHG